MVKNSNGDWDYDIARPDPEPKKLAHLRGSSFYFGISLLRKLGFNEEEMSYIQAKQMER
jgi:hypothetical protein